MLVYSQILVMKNNIHVYIFLTQENDWQKIARMNFRIMAEFCCLLWIFRTFTNFLK